MERDAHENGVKFTCASFTDLFNQEDEKDVVQEVHRNDLVLEVAGLLELIAPESQTFVIRLMTKRRIICGGEKRRGGVNSV